MNNGSTNVPGMGRQMGGGNIYQRQQGSQPRQGTVVPGMNNQAPQVQQSSPNEQPAVPVVGFLYSISRQGFGEFWPLHVGTNVIGSAEDCQIRLREQTVSGHHASLFIRQMKSSRKMIASIRDEGSKNGIFVNNEELTYDAHECHNRDVITVGNNYQLLFILIDADEMGLTVSENFMPLEGDAVPAMPQQPQGGRPPFQPQQPFQPVPQQPYGGGTQALGGGPMPPQQQPFQPGPQPGPNPMYDPSRRPASGGTMSLDGTVDNQPGGTQFL